MFRKFILIIPALLFFSESFSQPVATFTISRQKICSGSVFTVINSSSGANKYEWLLDGNHYSNAIDTAFKIYENCYVVIPIELIATDTVSLLSDTFTKFVEVFDSCFFHLTGDFLKCPGDTVSLSRHPDAIASFWEIIPGVNFLTGCDTCMSVSYIIPTGGSSVDLHNTYLGNCTEIVSYHYMCGSIGVEELQKDFRIFPNPFIDIISIESRIKIENVLIYNNLGSLICKLKYENSQINLNELLPGIYLIRLESGNDLSEGIRVVKL